MCSSCRGARSCPSSLPSAHTALWASAYGPATISEAPPSQRPHPHPRPTDVNCGRGSPALPRPQPRDRVGDWSDVPVLCSPTPRAPSLEAPPSDTTWGSGLGPAVCGCSWELPSPVTSVPWKLLLLLLLTELYIFSFEFKSFKKL